MPKFQDIIFAVKIASNSKKKNQKNERKCVRIKQFNWREKELILFYGTKRRRIEKRAENSRNYLPCHSEQGKL